MYSRVLIICFHGNKHVHVSNYTNVQPDPNIWHKLQHPNHTFVSVAVMILDNYWITGMIVPIYSPSNLWIELLTRVNHRHKTEG